MDRGSYRSLENIVEIAWRIFGEQWYSGKGLLRGLVSSERGVQGWADLMRLRLYCSRIRQGGLDNVYAALHVHQDKKAAQIQGRMEDLVLKEMRRMSQEIFALFKQTYIDGKRNFFAEVDHAPQKDFVGNATWDDSDEEASRELALAEARTALKTFVIYQLSNRQPSTTDIGYGIYDVAREVDGRGIGAAMDSYVFDFCFNPAIKDDNVFHFLDYCLANMNSEHIVKPGEAQKIEIAGGLSPACMVDYWRQHGDAIRNRKLEQSDRKVVTPNRWVYYRDFLTKLYDELDRQGGVDTATFDGAH